jgi:hypothetical protein
MQEVKGMRIFTQKRSHPNEILTYLNACCKNNIWGKKVRVRSDIAQHRPDVKAYAFGHKKRSVWMFHTGKLKLEENLQTNSFPNVSFKTRMYK